jgi:hypothetical protein
MRILMTRCVGKAWEQFCTTRKEVVVQSFRKLGISLPIDGSCDEELSIKGLDPEVLRSGLKEWETRRCHQEQDEYSKSESSDSGEDLAHLLEGLNCDSSEESEVEPEELGSGLCQAPSQAPSIMNDDSSAPAITSNDSTGSAVTNDDSPGSADVPAAPTRGNRRGRPRGRPRGQPRGRTGRQMIGKS